MQIYPIPNHATLPDMPSATNDDHDGRYYTESEVDTMLGDGTVDHGNLAGLTGQGAGGGANDHGLGSDDSPSFAGITLGTLTITDGSIDDTDGAIAFGATNFTGVGTIGCGAVTSNSTGEFTALGVGASPVPAYRVNMGGTYTNSAASGGFVSVATHSLNGNVAGSSVGMGSTWTVDPNGNDITTIQALFANIGVQCYAGGASTIDEVVGASISIYLYDDQTSTLTDLKGLHIKESVSGITWAGTIPTATGLYIDDVSAWGDTTWAIYSAGGNSYFAGAITSNTTIQAEQLTSTDDITMQGHLLTMGDVGAATDTVLSFLGSTNSGDITYDESADKFLFGSSEITAPTFNAGASNSYMSETDVSVNTNLDVTGGYVETSEIRIPAADASALNIKTATTSAMLISTNLDPFVIDFNRAALVGMSRWALYDELGMGAQLLSFRNNENLSGNKNLDFVTGDASRTITFSGNPTLGDWFDQDVKSTAAPEFHGLTIGDGTNELTVSATGDLALAGTATVWNDMQFQISDAKVTPASLLPSWEAFTTNTSEYAFSVNDEVDTSANEIPHSWKEGTAGHAHIHITTKAINNTEVTYAKFTVTFAYADTDEVWAEAPLTAEVTIANPTAALTNLYLDLGDITLTNNLIETQMRCRVERIPATTGTEYVGDIFVTQVGIHFEEDTIGSRTETAK